MGIAPRPLQPVAGASGIASRTLTENNMRSLDPASFPFPRRGNSDAPILVICDSPTIEAMAQGLPDTKDRLAWFAKRALQAGFVEEDIQFIALCSPIMQTDLASASRKWAHVAQFQDGLRALVDQINPEIVVTCGELASRIMLNRAVKITKARGIVTRGYNNRLTFPVLSPKLVTKQPDYLPVFEADLGTLQRLKKGNFDPATLAVTDVNYQWATDLQFMIDDKPKMLAVDTEGSGLKYRADGYKVYTIQLTPEPGVTYILPTSWDYYERHREQFEANGIVLTPEDITRIVAQCKVLLEDPSIQKMAHNFKFDDGCLNYGLGIDVKGWEHDTELMTRTVCENYMSYSLADCVRIYVPEMSGYSDAFDQTVDKSKMIDVPPFDIMNEDGTVRQLGLIGYAGGDPDAVFRLARALWPMMRREPGQMFLYKNVQMRGLLSFAKRIESFGQCIDRDALDAYKIEVESWIADEQRALFRMVPSALRRKYLLDPKGASFSRDVFMQEVLFGALGFNLKPRVWTKTTAKLPMEQRIPSVSAKDHLPYFEDAKGTAGEFVRRYIHFKKAQKLASTYINGFYKYILPANDNSGEEKIYPSYNFRTNTYRTNSQDPNGQNFPKRGNFAAGFLRLIKASAGKILIAADMSQVELRLVAWSAMEKEMLRIYNTGGDIHTATAAATLRLTIEEFMALPKEMQKLQRFRAKAVNFGFIYGAMWKTFQTYAKTNYGADYTDSEAEETRDLYFEKYQLLPWHASVEQFVKDHGYVETLHGGRRHLPSVWSDDWQVHTGAIRQAINSPIQRMGSDLGVIAIARLAAQVDPRLMRPVGFVHDQIICEVDPAYKDQAMAALCWVMENPPLNEWFGINAPLPFLADPEYGYNLAETTEVKRSDIDIVKPEWWNDDEQQAYQNFMRGTIPAWEHMPVKVPSPRARTRVVVG